MRQLGKDHCRRLAKDRQSAPDGLYLSSLAFGGFRPYEIAMTSALIAKIVCPRCHTEVDAHQERCPACHAFMGPSPAAENASELRVIDRPWILAVLILHVGLLGIPMYWKTRYSVRTRVLICVLSVVYTLFAVAFIGGVGWWLYRQFTGG